MQTLRSSSPVRGVFGTGKSRVAWAIKLHVEIDRSSPLSQHSPGTSSVFFLPFPLFSFMKHISPPASSQVKENYRRNGFWHVPGSLLRKLKSEGEDMSTFQSQKFGIKLCALLWPVIGSNTVLNTMTMGVYSSRSRRLCRWLTSLQLALT